MTDNDRRIAYNFQVFKNYFGIYNGMDFSKESLTIYELKDFIHNNPMFNIGYEYALLSIMENFNIDNQGYLRGTDAHGNTIVFDLEAEDYEFFIENFYL